MSDESVAVAPREQGWAGVLLALAAFLLIPVIPVAGALFPVTEGWVLLLPAIATCTLLGWWAGGRASLAVFWIILAAFTLLGSRASWGPYGTLLRAWAIILAGARRQAVHRGRVGLGTGRAVDGIAYQRRQSGPLSGRSGRRRDLGVRGEIDV